MASGDDTEYVWDGQLSEERARYCDLRQRTTQFALRIVRLCSALPNTTEAHVLGAQLLRSGTSVGANYREAARARTRREFASKMGICRQEIEETDYWLELLANSGIVTAPRLADLRGEVNELTAILVTAVKTAKSRQPRPGSPT